MRLELWKRQKFELKILKVKREYLIFEGEFQVYYAEHFRLLRKLLFAEGEDAFVRSLSRSTNWDPQGGKSGASFYRTEDGRFVFKQMSRFEIQSFLKFAPNYFHYVSTAATENKLTTLCKVSCLIYFSKRFCDRFVQVYGVYRIGYKNFQTGYQLKLDVLVMEYLFYRRNVKQVWDLKGSQRNRLVVKFALQCARLWEAKE